MVKNPATKDWHLRPNHALDERVEDLIFLTKLALKISKTLNSAIKVMKVEQGIETMGL